MIDYRGMVREFHEKYSHYIGTPEIIPPEDVQTLRWKLILEEAYEFRDASWVPDDDLVERADALADLLYVVFGAAITYGIPIEAVFAEVHRSNMTKSLEKDTTNVIGKTIKGQDYEPPNLRPILERAMKLNSYTE